MVPSTQQSLNNPNPLHRSMAVWLVEHGWLVAWLYWLTFK
jgi:hypothetical protein